MVGRAPHCPATACIARCLHTCQPRSEISAKNAGSLRSGREEKHPAHMVAKRRSWPSPSAPLSHRPSLSTTGSLSKARWHGRQERRQDHQEDDLQGGAIPDGRHWTELAHIIENLSAQVQVVADAGSREAEQVGGWEQTTRQFQSVKVWSKSRGPESTAPRWRSIRWKDMLSPWGHQQDVVTTWCPAQKTTVSRPSWNGPRHRSRQHRSSVQKQAVFPVRRDLGSRCESAHAHRSGDQCVLHCRQRDWR